MDHRCIGTMGQISGDLIRPARVWWHEMVIVTVFVKLLRSFVEQHPYVLVLRAPKQLPRDPLRLVDRSGRLRKVPRKGGSNLKL